MRTKRQHSENMASAVFSFVSVLIAFMVVVVQIFNATRHPGHMETAAIVMYMYLYSLAFMDHPCTRCLSPSAALSS